MSEDNVQKKALREKYLNDIAQELDAELKKNSSKSQSLRSIKFDENGDICMLLLSQIQHLLPDVLKTQYNLSTI